MKVQVLHRDPATPEGFERARAIVVLSDEMISGFMQRADVFEKFKVIAQAYEWSHLAPVKTKVVDRVKSIIGASNADNKVVAIALSHGGCTYIWTHPEIKAISDGHMWAPITDAIRGMAFHRGFPTDHYTVEDLL
jgi:hypothetical protein